jgi:hypothetical protein
VPKPNALQAWTLDRVIAELPRLGRFDQREPLGALSDQRDALCQALRRALHTREGSAQLNAAVMLLKLQDHAGRDVFLEALNSGDAATLTSAMNFNLAPHDTRYNDPYHTETKVPISGAEIFAAISRCLREPQSELGGAALFTCLKHDIEASRALTRPLLTHSSGALRLLVAEWYLIHGRDDGALHAIEALYETAPSNPDNKDPSWYRLKTSWSFIHECCRRSAETLRTEAARMAMRIVRRTLDAPERKHRTHVNDGFVDIASATRAIACVMPDGAEALLERIIAGSFDDFGVGDDYGRGQAIIALAAAVGERSRELVRARLADTSVRKYAAAAFGGIAKGRNNPDDIASLADALAKEERADVIGSILTALAGVGPDAEPHVNAAIERAPPWTRMELLWQLEGLSAREIANMLTEAGVMDAIGDAALAEATQNGVDLMGLIWEGGRRLAYMNIKCDSIPPPHHALFNAIIDIARPRIEVKDLSQIDNDNYRREPVPDAPGVTAVSDLGTICTVGFVHEDVAHRFSAQPSGRWLDVAAVMEGFNQFMTAIGREDRCFQLTTGDSYCFFLVAPETKFRKVAARLHIPLEPDSDRARRQGIAYARQVVGPHRRA